mmetsp:Transcript_15702/g.31286  ORF Transcript_15702/g.31286 Transcript_15702/m.31286 type:complete len:569 (-) Transcript_15702:20-1726(-)
MKIMMQSHHSLLLVLLASTASASCTRRHHHLSTVILDAGMPPAALSPRGSRWVSRWSQRQPRENSCHPPSLISAAFSSPPLQLSCMRDMHQSTKARFRRYLSADASFDQGGVDGKASSSMTKLQKIRFRCRVSYFGTPFHGWQLQPERSTVQGEIEAAFLRRWNRRIPTVGAGRTDAGVHARGQAIHFDLYPHEIPFLPPTPPELSSFDKKSTTESHNANVALTAAANFQNDREEEKCNKFCNELQHSMNRMLPLDIRLFQMQLAPYTLMIKSSKKGNVNEYDEDDEEDDVYENNNHDGTVKEPMGTDASQTKHRLQPLRPRPWHVIQSADSKWYSYRFVLGPTLWNPMDRYTRTHFVHRPIYLPPNSSSEISGKAVDGNNGSGEPHHVLTKQDIDRLQSILRLYEGTHDFGAFGGQIEQTQKRNQRVMDTIRTVYRVELVKEPLMEDYHFGSGIEDVDAVESAKKLHQPIGFVGEEGNYRIDFLLQGALYKMVRNMVGTAIEVWLGRMEEEKLMELLQPSSNCRFGFGIEESNSHDGRKKLRRKDNPCKPAPPEGLTLECVYYEDEF